MKKIKKRIRKLFVLLLNTMYYFLYHHVPLDDHLVFLESRDGKDFAGNILRIAEALSTGDYGRFKMIAHVDRKTISRAKTLRKTYQLNHLYFTTKRSLSLLAMEHARFIVSDSGVPWKYVKKDGQVVLNTWHGTPLKHMGVRIASEKHAVGTVQHFFLSSDFFVCPSDYVKQVMPRDYMVQNVMSGKALMTGYPRNAVFFDDERRKLLQSELGIRDKRVSAYMPTWRGTIKSIRQQDSIEEFTSILSEIDARLGDDQIVFAKPHPFIASKVDYAQFVHVRPFPEEYDTYDVLNIVDCLVTDYSSVFFDFANSGKKIVLFAYDEEEYLAERGMYLDINDFPFPIVRSIDDLVFEMITEKAYCDVGFRERFCTHDARNAVDDLCRHVFMGERRCREVSLGNGKENVLIMGGGLAKNGITSSLINLLSNIDLQQRNYFVSYRRWELNAEPRRLDAVPGGAFLLPLMSQKYLTLREHLAYKRFLKGDFASGEIPKMMERALARELNRCFYGAVFSNVVQFDGYNNDSILLLSQIKDAKRSIWVHNDMQNEMTTKKNQNKAVLEFAYRNYDNVAIVSTDLRRSTAEISGREDNIVVVRNIHDYSSVLKRAESPLELQPDTIVRCWNPRGIEGVLGSPCKKLISIGRFSPEKGHERLLRAFDEYHQIYPEDQLIIIGGLGWMFDRTVNLASKLSCWNRVTLIKSIKNPMPILAQCDLFVLSSFYEGLPLVIAEADTLGVPVVSTDIVALQGFMRDNKGYLVASSQDGILEGLLAFREGKVKPMNIDFKAYNHEALAAFESLLLR